VTGNRRTVPIGRQCQFEGLQHGLGAIQRGEFRRREVLFPQLPLLSARHRAAMSSDRAKRWQGRQPRPHRPSVFWIEVHRAELLAIQDNSVAFLYVAGLQVLRLTGRA